MSVTQVQALKLHCNRCGYEALRFALPKCCPKCKSPNWNRIRLDGRNK